MATQVEKNWINKLKEHLNMASTHREGAEQSREIAPGDEARTALRKVMAKEVFDRRMRSATYGYLTMI